MNGETHFISKNNTMEFCTIFDNSYTPKGLTLYRSLENLGIKLHILCLDSDSHRTLISLDLKNVIIYKLEDLEREDPKLLDLKNLETESQFGSQWARYCWALTPYFTNMVLEASESESILYIDADLYFYDGVDEILQEVEKCSIGIVTHRHEHHLRNNTPSGKYNVGIVFFRKDEEGIACSRFWKDLLMNPQNEYAKEYGTCGDQKYLELFEVKFPSRLHIIDDLVGHGAPWCFDSYTYLEKYKIVWRGKTQRLVFNHFSHFVDNVESWSSSHSGEWKPENVNPYVKEYYDDYHKEIRETVKIFGL